MKPRTGHILVLASDGDVARRLDHALAADGHGVEVFADGQAALAAIERATPDVVLSQLELERMDGFEFLERARALAPRSSFVALTVEGSVDTIVEAIRRGADQCLTRPVQLDALRVVVDRALDKPLLARQASQLRQRVENQLAAGNFERIVGAHPTMQRLVQKAFQAAQSRASVLIQGETGTGKELIAAAIHHNSKRRAGPFVRVNCAALAENLLESELFGHERGAFTGATVRRKGRFEQAHGGTLFLDEVSEIPKPLQVKLLRFLQEREMERVGGDETIHVDTRVVAATNRNLQALVEDGAFREDLFYRLDVVRLEVPPLRARPSDVAMLAEHFLRRYAADNDKEVVGISGHANAMLLAHPWPGNVRELQNVVEQAVVLSRGPYIEADDLPFAQASSSGEPLRLMIPGISLAELERYTIVKTLEAVGNSPTRAARILGVSRRTVQYRMREWGIKPGLP